MSATATALQAPVAVRRWVRDEWAALTSPTELAPPFDPQMIEDLPVPARRWLLHAIAPGTPLCQRVVLGQHGKIRLGDWRPFTAKQALAPLQGFVWRVATNIAGLPIFGVDRFFGGAGHLRHKLLGLIPVVTADGPDIDRSAAARHTSEIIWVPGAALASSVVWEAVDNDRVTLSIPCGPWILKPTLTISASGSVVRMTVPRWTDHGGRTWHEEPFTAILSDERTFGGYTIPTRVTAGWSYGTPLWDVEGSFIDLSIDRAEFR